MTSTIKTNKVSSNVELQLSELATTAADTVANSKWFTLPNAQDSMFALQQTSAGAGVLTGFHFEVIDGKDKNGVEISIDAAGDLVESASIDSGTGIGATAVLDADLTICVVKDRFEQCYPTMIDTDATPPVVMGDTGGVGNKYLLEIQQSEMHYAKACKAPCFYRLAIMTKDAAETFTVAAVHTGHHFANPPITKEIIT